MGIRTAVVGVSMGAIIAATYALNDAWYDDLLTMDTRGLPTPLPGWPRGIRERIRAAGSYRRTIWTMLRGWGAGAAAVPYGRGLLDRLTRGRALEDAALPVAVVATDLVSGHRVVLRSGSATEALYASAALAGLVPPLSRDGALLADGGYVDIAPVDVARDLGTGPVIAVDPSPEQRANTIGSGMQALVRALEICHNQHAHLRFALADLVLRPRFPRPIDTLDFGYTRTCVSAGIRAVRRARTPLRRLLDNAPVEEREGGSTKPGASEER
jgi:NTE family protein